MTTSHPPDHKLITRPSGNRGKKTGFGRLANLGFADHPLADEIQWERHQLFMKEVGPRMIATVVVAVVVGLLFINSAPLPALLTWFGLNLFVSLNSWLIIRRYHRHEASTERSQGRPDIHDPQQQQSIHRWHLANLYLALIWGFQWAAVPLLFFPDASLVQVFSLLLVITITSSMPSMTMGLYPDVYIAFLTPVLGAFGWHLFNMDLGDVWLHKAMAPGIWISLVGFSYAMFKTQIHSLILRLELQQSKQEIEQANNAKTRFLAAASHDIRQPLQAASLYWSAINADTLSKTQQPLFERLGASLKATNELLNHLLDVSRLDAGVAQPRYQAVKLADLLTELKVVFLPLAEQKGLELLIQTDDLTPDQPVMVSCDPAMTLQIFKNLIANAIQYTPRGKVIVSTRRQGEQIQVDVKDTGIGIPPEHQQAVFEEFVQLANPGRQRKKGLGLGLSIVSRLCRVQQLPLQLTSESQQGSCFSVSLPLATGQDCHASANRSSASQQPDNSLSGLKVLVVDDHEDILDALSMLLVSWDCDVWIADSISSLNNQLRQPACQPDVVISDDMLGDDGQLEQVIASLQAGLDHDPEIIIMTGNTRPERIRQLQRFGAPLLHKPLQSEQLWQTLLALKSRS
ncbi:ATP-binding response regulator [Oceanobacter mangrovi]|uniref:ATP-binding response regulator n=1 Tax=Oceanobacter mangrovi TaxID=2862510 RepID=UPI001C8E5A4F|nr:hybrid sensor histidine kinase/response regulator [Oceanobacter mangrovi]